MSRTLALFIFILFGSSAFAQSEMYADFTNLPYSPPTEARTLFFPNQNYIGYSLNRCEPFTLENRVYVTDYTWEVQTKTIEYAPNKTCSGRITQGAQGIDIVSAVLPTGRPNFIYSVDLNLYMANPITTTETWTTTRPNIGLISSYTRVTPGRVGAGLYLELVDFGRGTLEERPPSNVASCSTNLGTIVLTGPFYQAIDNSSRYVGNLRVAKSDVEGRELIPLQIQCTRPLAGVRAGGSGAVVNYSPDDQFPGGWPFMDDPTLILNARVRIQPSSSDYMLKKTVVDPSTGDSVSGDEAPVRIEPSYLRPPPTARCANKPEIRNKRVVVLTCLNKQTGQAVEGCQVNLNMALGDRHGGHTHDTPNRPLGSFSPNSMSVNIPAAGYSFTYEAPEVAGNVEFSFSGIGPNGAALEVSPPTFDI